MARILSRPVAVVLNKKEATSTLTAILDLNVTTDEYVTGLPERISNWLGLNQGIALTSR